MRQRKRKTLKELARERRQARHGAKSFKGTCSKCRAKGVPVTKYKSAQICGPCLSGALSRAGDVTQLPASQAITVEPSAALGRDAALRRAAEAVEAASGVQQD